MKPALVSLLLVLAVQASAMAQESEPSPRSEKRSLFNRMLHPFRSNEQLPEYKDAHLNGLILSVEVSPQPVKLSEVRQMDVRVTLTNKSRRPIPLEFANAQRFEILLRSSAGGILATWSDNHAFADEPGSVMINPQEHIEYAETIATRELTANRVFIAEVFFPKYPDLRVAQKFMTAP
jgi:Intracellular proteinase inhibitor